MSPITLSLKDRVAIVTGASRGIGKAIAVAFGEAGASVVCASRTAADLENTAAEIREKGARALVVPTDTSIKQDIDHMVSETVAKFGTVDILVNCGARSLFVPLMKLREDGWDKMLDSHLKGYFLCIQAAAKVMMEHKKGNIINIGSVMSSLVNPYNGAYGTAKAGVLQLTRILASELAHSNIRCNYISPGWIKTKMTEALWTNQQLMERWQQIIPLGRFAEPEEVATAAVFLASDFAGYITGSNLIVDGGVTLSGVGRDVFGAVMPEDMRI